MPPLWLAVLLTLSPALCPRAASLLLNSNAIKTVPGSGPVSAPPELPVGDNIEPVPPPSCLRDDECPEEEFCYSSRGACLPCRKRRKRCTRDAMCCPGNHCSNGVCLPSDVDPTLYAGVEDLVAVTAVQENVTVAPPASPKRSSPAQPHSLKGQEGENCLRSSDCAPGLCCARHFWSKICKPVLKEGQVCTKHRRKGSHGLEIFQRCDCGDAMSCRIQRADQNGKSSRSLHTCQRH